MDRICLIIRLRWNHFCYSHRYWETGKSRRIESLYSASSISIGGEVGWMAVAAAGFRGWPSSNVAISFHRSCLTAIVSPGRAGVGSMSVTKRHRTVMDCQEPSDWHNALWIRCYAFLCRALRPFMRQRQSGRLTKKCAYFTGRGLDFL